MIVEKLCQGKYERAMRADRGCWSCRSAAECIPPREELTMAGDPQYARHQSAASTQRAKELG